MKLFRSLFLGLFFLITGGLIAILGMTSETSPFFFSLANFFQVVGQPIKSIDRIVDQLLPINAIDEKDLGDQLKALFEVQYPLKEEDLETFEKLNRLLQSLSSESKSHFEYQIFLSEGEPNAFSYPGGVIRITRSLIDLLDDEGELASVIAHELGHIERGHLFSRAKMHLLKKKYRFLSIATFVGEILNSTFRITYSKAEEDEADEYAFHLICKKGYSPFAVSKAFEKLETLQDHAMVHPIGEFFQTHPHLTHRIAKFRAKAKQKC